MVVSEYSAPRLGLSEAYHVVNRWLTHVGAVPRAIDEPVDGVVELTGSGFHARIRIHDTALPQGAVLGLLRVVGDRVDIKLMLWSVTDFTTGATVFADTQGVALFHIAGDGDVVPRNSHARVIMPAEPLEPAFAKPIVVEPPPPPVEEPEVDKDESGKVAWRDCPRCGATHHPRSNFCASCGADLHTRLTVVGPQTGALPAPSKLDSRGGLHGRYGGDPVPRARPDGPTLRCRTCGSHDIELIHPH